MLNKLNFSYDYRGVISEEAFKVHMQLYDGYVGKVNEIHDILKKDPQRDAANATYSHFRELKKEESYAMDGVILHELYFDNMGTSQVTGEDIFKKFSITSFNSYEDWKKDFIACAKSARGWVVCSYDQRTGRLHNICQDSHSDGEVWLAYPILVLDMYEHAYYIDYKNKKDNYIDAFLKNINWNVVDMRLKKLVHSNITV